jgi:hypothetical protein
MRFSHLILRAAMLVAAIAAAPASANSPGQPADQEQAVPQSELDEILPETRRRMRHEDPADLPWTSLDRDKLARILRMPGFARIEGKEKNFLIDQAGAWELMPFARPSDAWDLWAPWFPGSPAYQVLDPAARELLVSYGPQTFNADEHWGDESGAMIALMTCLPSAAWYVRHMDPMVWAVESGQGYEQPDVSFRGCVRKQREYFGRPWRKSPDTRRGLASARIIEDRLSAHLLASGCSGAGPDSCLPLLHALVSLNPENPRLRRILARLEPSFELGRKYKIPAKTDQSGAATCTATPARREVLRKIIFLTAKVDLMTQHRQGWKRGELESTLRQLLRHDLVLAELGQRPAWCNDGISVERHGFANPLPRLGATDAAMWVRLGRGFRGPEGCRFSESPKGTPKAFNDACEKPRPTAKSRRGLTRSGNDG